MGTWARLCYAAFEESIFCHYTVHYTYDVCACISRHMLYGVSLHPVLVIWIHMIQNNPWYAQACSRLCTKPSASTTYVTNPLTIRRWLKWVGQLWQIKLLFFCWKYAQKLLVFREYLFRSSHDHRFQSPGTPSPKNCTCDHFATCEADTQALFPQSWEKLRYVNNIDVSTTSL